MSYQVGRHIIRLNSGPPGPPGPPYRQDISLFWNGAVPTRLLLYSVQLEGGIAFDQAHSPLTALVGATSLYTLSVAKNATYANPLSPTPSEIAAALWATGVFQAGGQGGIQHGLTTYVGGTPGVAAAGDVLDVWTDVGVDATLNTFRWTLAGA